MRGVTVEPTGVAVLLTGISEWARTVRVSAPSAGPVGGHLRGRTPALRDYKFAVRIGKPQVSGGVQGRLRGVVTSRTRVIVASLITSAYGSDSSPASMAAFSRATASVRRR